VQQKVAAAEAAGAEYFLSPPDNYADALSVAHHIKVIEIATAQQAVDFFAQPAYNSSRIVSGDSMIFFTRTKKSTASLPSTIRWS